MMKYKVKYTHLFTVLVSLFILQSTDCQTNWYRGNTHTHTNKSDGKLPPIDAVNAYKAEGYHFLFITDEDKLVPTEEFSNTSFLCFTGEEAIMETHVSCLNILRSIPPSNFFDVVDSTNAQGGFAVINHPMRNNHRVFAREVSVMENVHYIEIFNGKSEKDGAHDDQTLWDSILTAGKLIYGVASDDFHEMKHIKKGWIMVAAKSLKKDSIIKSISEGKFYSSTGVFINDLEVTDSSIFLATENAIDIQFIGDKGRVLSAVKNDSAFYRITGEEGYIRVVASNYAKQMAWTQPLFWDKTFVGIPPKVYPEPTYIISDSKTMEWKVYPNPVKETLFISLNLDKVAEADITLLDHTGRIVYTQKYIAGSSTIELNMSKLNQGVYFLLFNSKDVSKISRLIKQ